MRVACSPTHYQLEMSTRLERRRRRGQGATTQGEAAAAGKDEAVGSVEAEAEEGVATPPLHIFDP